MRVVRLTLDAADLGAQEGFWAGTLGLEVAREDEDEIEVRLRSAAIRFRRAAPGTAPRHHFAINVPPGSIERAAAWVAERHELLAFHGVPDEEEGATIVHADRGTPAVYFLDPAGNVVELIANVRLADSGVGGGGRDGGPTDRDGTGADVGAGDQAAFGPKDLLDVAEIGIAAADPDATCAAIGEFLGEDVLWGGAPDWLLTAIGDAHSVVIVAPVDRRWIPIGLPARPAPTEIVVRAADSAELTLPEGPYVLRRIRAA
jgi:catechol 2,3-dioxygenase-like lactoylglutathione lyase family enzyme